MHLHPGLKSHCSYIRRIRWTADHPTATPIDRNMVGHTGINSENPTAVKVHKNSAHVIVFRGSL